MSEEPVKFLSLGAIIQEFKVNGINIVQGFDTEEQYQKYNGPYFGETIGRVANRVGGAKVCFHISIDEKLQDSNVPYRLII